MAVKVLVVDDSAFFKRCIKEILSTDKHIEVIGTASDGKEAIKKCADLKPDVITMDVEMPVMDGITAVRSIMQETPTPILMLSSLTQEGARITLDALDAGAVDFLPKDFNVRGEGDEQARRQLCARVRILGARGLRDRSDTSRKEIKKPDSVVQQWKDNQGRRSKRRSLRDFDLVAIGTSTGGPLALQKVLAKLPKSFPLPILIIQHMPGTFTPAFAQRLNNVCNIDVRQAVDHAPIEKGCALLAPGGFQMLVERKGDQGFIRVQDAVPGQVYRPSVDITFTSIAKAYKDKVLAIVLTGMGADGKEGACLLKQQGSTVWAQDEESCVVYGMPMAVSEAGYADEILSLEGVGDALIQGL
ncbi:MAG: chemotaxis response regulator protein-glutamate methylesterase [Gammaproteobacteria bacterium]